MPETQISSGSQIEASVVIPALPVRVAPNRLEVIDWRALLPELASLPTTTAVLKYEIERVAADENDLHGIERAERVTRAAGMIIDRVESGHLQTMSDVATAIDFVGDHNPSLQRVSAFFDKGYSVTKVTQIYDAREVVDVSLGVADELYAFLGFSYNDEDAGNMLSEAIDVVTARYDINERYRDVAAKKVLELAASGMTMLEILDLTKASHERF